MAEPKAKLRVETLAVCVLLSAFEVSTNLDTERSLLTFQTADYRRYWRYHAALAHTYGWGSPADSSEGAQRHQTSFGHQIFLHFRANSVSSTFPPNPLPEPNVPRHYNPL